MHRWPVAARSPIRHAASLGLFAQSGVAESSRCARHSFVSAPSSGRKSRREATRRIGPRAAFYTLLTVLLGCQEAEECGQWTDFAASVGIDESQTLHCGSYSDNSPDEDVAKVRACLWTAYDQGQLAKMHQSRSVEGTNADVVSTGVTTYVRPPDREPRLLEFRTVTELWEDGSTTEETSAWACDDVTTTDAPSVGCRVYRRLCP